MFTTVNIVLVIAATLTALVAGLFYAWSCSITLGLARLPDEGYLAAMQQTNRAILNPVFFAGFFGAMLLLPLSTWLHYGTPQSPRFWFLLAASILYLAGVMGVTIFGNIPLNESLDKFDLQHASSQAMAMKRAGFEKPWNSLNLVRTVAATLSTMLVTIACLSPHKG